MALEIRQLSKFFGDVAALDRIDASIATGGFTTLLGPSGSGKSTLLMCLAGFATPSEGRIALDGRDVTDLPAEKRGFGVVFQGYALFPHMNVAANLGFPLKMRGLGRSEIDARVARALDLVQLEGYEARRPSELSGGQQQRVALARALIFDPAVVLLDEPLSALDRALRANLREELKRIHRTTGATFLMVTHDQEEALALSDRVIVLNEGRIVQQGTPRDLYDRPESRFAAEFVGTTNLFEVAIEEEGSGEILCAAAGARFRHRPAVARAWPHGRRVLFSLRPETIALTGPEAVAADDNRLAGRVGTATFEGFDLMVDVDTDLGPLKVRMRSQAAPEGLAPGAPVALTWSRGAGHIVLGD